MRDSLVKVLLAVGIACIMFNCSNRKATAQLRSGIDLTSLPLIQKDPDSAKYTPKVRVDSKAFNGVFASPLILGVDSFCAPFILYNAWGGKCICYAGYKNFEGSIFYNMKVAIENRLSFYLWNEADSQCEIRVNIDSVSIMTRYVYRCVLALGYNSHNEYCEPTEMALKVSYDLLCKGKPLKSDTVQKRKVLTEKICCVEMLLDSSNAGQYFPDGDCKGVAPGVQPGLVIHNTMNYSYYHFNRLIEDCAQEIGDAIRRELYK